MSTLTSSCSWKAGDVVSDQFPAGLRVLVVDDDPTCLRIMEKMLKTCQYQGGLIVPVHDARFHLRILTDFFLSINLI